MAMVRVCQCVKIRPVLVLTRCLGALMPPPSGFSEGIPKPRRRREPEPEPEPHVAHGGEQQPVKVLHLFISEHEQKTNGGGKSFVEYGALAHILYASGAEGEWWIFRRYNEWLGLYSVLQTVSSSCPKPPPKRMWSDRNTIARRQTALNKWLAEVVSEEHAFAETTCLLQWIREGRVARAERKCTRNSPDLRVRIPSVALHEDGGLSASRMRVGETHSAAFMYTVRVESCMCAAWEVLKRFSQFAALRRELAVRHPTLLLPATPARTLMVTEAVANQRRETLAKFLTTLLRLPEIAADEVLLAFLDAPPLIRGVASGAPPTMQGQLRVLKAASVKHGTRTRSVHGTSRWLELRGTGLCFSSTRHAAREGSVDVSAADISWSPAERLISICNIAEATSAAGDGGGGGGGGGRGLVNGLQLFADNGKAYNAWARAISQACGDTVPAAAERFLDLAEEEEKEKEEEDGGGGGDEEEGQEEEGDDDDFDLFADSAPQEGDLFVTLPSPTSSDSQGCCSEAVIMRLQESLRDFGGLPQLAVTSACIAAGREGFVAVCRQENEYAIVHCNVPSAIQASAQEPITVVSVACVVAMEKTLDFCGQPDPCKVLVATSASDEHVMRLETAAGAAALLSELARVHGVVAKQGMMGALSGFEWLDRLKAVRRLPPADEKGEVGSRSGGESAGEGELLSWAYWAPEGGWISTPNAGTAGVEGGPPYTSSSGSSSSVAIDEAVASAAGVKLFCRQQDEDSAGTLPAQRASLGAKAVTFYTVELQQDLPAALLLSSSSSAAGAAADSGSSVTVAGRWSVLRRFSDFEALREVLLEQYAEVTSDLQFPPKASKAGALSGTDLAVVSTREVALFLWLGAVLAAANDSAVSSTIARSPELLVFLGMRRAAQHQREAQRKKNPWTSRAMPSKATGRVTRRAGYEVESTDRLGRSIMELVASQSGAPATPEIIDEQLVECAAFRAITPKLSYVVREVITHRVKRRANRRTMWLSTEEVELFDEVGERTLTIAFRSISRVKLVSPLEFEIAWFATDEKAAKQEEMKDAAASICKAGAPGQVMEMESMDSKMDHSLSSPTWTPQS
jgi:hypothetical protein